MVLAALIFLNAMLSVNADLKAACANKAAGDICEYVNNKGTCCSMIRNAAKKMEKFCRDCEKPGAKTHSECTIHSRQGYLGCFSKPEDAAVFQVCVGQTKGGQCMYETAASTRGGGTPAYNTSGNCIAHFYHQGIMCLEAIGDEDDEECHGKGVGQPCTHSKSANAICTHHPRRGTWMCSAPKEESAVFAVCQGQKKGSPCSYTSSGSHGTDAGLMQGVCNPHDETGSSGKGTTHSAMMCMDPDDLKTPPTATDAPSEDAEGFPLVLIIIAAAAVFSCLILAAGVYVMLRRRRAKKPTSSPLPAPNAEMVVGTPVSQSGEKVTP